MHKSNKFILFLLLLSFAAADSQAESLNDFLQEVAGKNLELTSQTKLIVAAQERSRGISLKPPTLGVSQMKSPMGVSYAFEVQQEIPLSNKLSFDKRGREERLELQKKVSLYDSQNILLQARLAFVSYWMNFEKIKLMNELQTWLKLHAQYAQSQARSSSDLKIYALDIESTVGLIENEISDLKDNLEVEKLRLKSLVYNENYEPGVPVLGMREELSPGTSSSQAASINLTALKVADLDLAVAKTTSMPNLMIGIRKMDRPMMGMADEEIMLGIDLPFAFFWQPRAEKAQAHANQFLAEAKFKKSQVESSSMKKTLLKRVEIINKKISTLENISLPSAEKRLRYLKNISPRDINGLDSHYKIFNDYILLKTKLLEARYQYEELYTNWTLLFSERKSGDL